MKKINICHIVDGDFILDGQSYTFSGGGANTRIFCKKTKDGKPYGDDIQISAYSTVEVTDKQAKQSKKFITNVIRNTKSSLNELECSLKLLKEQGVE